jgi:hypothetical protein
MRFMNLIKSTENAGSPPKALLDAIAKFGQEAIGTGWIVSAGGLFPSAMGARVHLSTGKLTISDGPFTESKELIGAYAIYKVASKQEAAFPRTDTLPFQDRGLRKRERSLRLKLLLRGYFGTLSGALCSRCPLWSDQLEVDVSQY